MRKNNVAHFEIYANDPKKLGRFYTDLFDWSLDPVPDMDYTLVKTVETDAKGAASQAGGINGGLMKRPKGYDTHAWLSYVNVESLDATIERAQKLGARVMKQRQAVPNMGWFAMLVDIEGNPFAIWQADKAAK
jgi:predicted enzyme related to lactoylglutathione lyase